MSEADGSAADVIVIGAGAAGIAAARRLRAAGRSVLVLEARGRVGGRACSVVAAGRWPLDLGCEWLHSADENPLVVEAEALGLTVDRSAPSWRKRAPTGAFTEADQRAFLAAQEEFQQRLEEDARGGEDRPAAASLTPDGRWNALLHAVSTYVNGVPLDELSVQDYLRYRDSGANWRLREGYGRFFELWARDLPVIVDCAVSRVDHDGHRIRVTSALGCFEARAAVVAVPTDVLASGAIAFAPDLPDHLQAARDLPLGADEKVFLALDRAEEFAPDTRLFGATDRIGVGTYAIRPMGMPVVEGFFGGDLARELAERGLADMGGFAIDEIAQALGAGMRGRLLPLAASSWSCDPFARGAYSHARIGRAQARALLAAPASDRLVFAGEACSPDFFTTAHGAAQSGSRAAELLLEAALRR